MCKTVFLGMLVIVISAVFIFPLPGFCVEKSDCVKMVEKSCTNCHSTGRICRNRVKDRSEIWWKSNIDNMVEYGAKLTKEERSEIFKCLFKSGAKIEKLCE